MNRRTRRRWLIVAAAALAVIGGLWFTALALLPASRAKRLRMGMTAAQVAAIMGGPSHVENDPGGTTTLHFGGHPLHRAWFAGVVEGAMKGLGWRTFEIIERWTVVVALDKSSHVFFIRRGDEMVMSESDSR